MIMGVGFVMMCAGVAILVADIVLVIITAATSRGKKQKMDEYLKEHY